MYYFDTFGKTNILGFASRPDFCAIPESFFFQKPANYYLACLEDCELDSLTFENLQSLFDKSQQIERLFRKLSESVIVGDRKRVWSGKSLTVRVDLGGGRLHKKKNPNTTEN